MATKREGADQVGMLERSMRFMDWTALRYNLLWAYEGEVLPTAMTGRYRNEDTSCWLIRKGSVLVKAGGSTVRAKAGQWIFVPSPVRHQHFEPGTRILSLHFHLSWPDGEQVIRRNKTVLLDAGKAPDLEKAGRPLARHVSKLFPGVGTFLPVQACRLDAFLKVQSLMPAWLSAYLHALAGLGYYPERLETLDDRVLRATAYLDHCPLGKPFDTAAFIRQSGLNRSRLDALFVALHGMTPRRYYEKRRLRAAQDLLRHGDGSIKEIAFGLGFRHSSHFSLWFRRLAGSSASEYREGT